MLIKTHKNDLSILFGDGLPRLLLLIAKQGKRAVGIYTFSWPGSGHCIVTLLIQAVVIRCCELNPPFSRSPVSKDVTNGDVTNHLSPKQLSLMKEPVVCTTGKPEGTDCDVDYYEAYLWSNMALRHPRYRYSFTKSPSVQFTFVFLFAFSSQLSNRLWFWNRMFRWN